MQLTKNVIYIIKKIIRKLINLFKIYILKDDFLIAIHNWQKDKGDIKLRLDYPQLDDQSIIFDIGGYLGDFSASMNEKYNCRVYLFEPHPQYYEHCRKRFIDNDKIVILNYGLSDKTGEFTLSDSQDGSSFLNPQHISKEGFICHLREYRDVLNELQIKRIDLMKINIEGGEFPLLEHIVSTERQSDIEQYQIQFHNFVDGAVRRRASITDALSLTHEKTWCYPFVWENWRKK